MDAGQLERVKREKEVNESSDIIRRSFIQKQRFSHTWSTLERIHKDVWETLGDLTGKRVLDYGCGKGDFATRLLQVGAQVDGIDISQSYIDVCYEAVRAAGIDESRYSFQVMDAHETTFDNGAFDVVIGNGILHHLNFMPALNEINRVLKVGGTAIFQEPLNGNPLLKLFRRLTPKARTPDEHPFTESDIVDIERGWKVNSRYYGIISAPVAVITSFLLRPWPNNFMLKGAVALEGRLPTTFMRSWNQYVLFVFVKL